MHFWSTNKLDGCVPNAAGLSVFTKGAVINAGQRESPIDHLLVRIDYLAFSLANERLCLCRKSHFSIQALVNEFQFAPASPEPLDAS